jgi:hypothetical protein
MQAVKLKKSETPKIPTRDISMQCVFTNLGICIADYYAQRDDARAKRRAKKLTTEQEISILQRISQLQDLKSKLIQNNDYSGVKKLIAQESRIINRTDEAKEMPFGEKCEALIFIITKLVVNELSDLRVTNPQLYKEYTEGAQKTYWLSTYTSSLCTQLNRNEMGFDVANMKGKEKRENKKFSALSSSFRGETGYYAALLDTGFIVEKDLEKNKVRLGINLEWIFGFSLNIFSNLAESAPAEPSFLGIGSGLSTGLSLNKELCSLKLTEYNESGAGSLSDNLKIAFPQVVDATNVAKSEKVEGEQEAIPSETATSSQNEKVKFSAPAENTQLVLDFAKDSANRALKLIFNAQNLENKRICYNSQSICETISPQDVRDMPFWMICAYDFLKKEDESWSDVANLVNEAIQNTADYMVKHPTRRIYHPFFWLDTQFSGGSMVTYINRFLRNRTFNVSTPQYTPQVLWALEHGADRSKLLHYVRKHGEKIVSDVIAYAGVRIARGIEPKNGRIEYIFGILRNLDPATIQFQLEIEKAKLAGHKNPKNNTAKWTESRVHKLINKLKLTQNEEAKLTPSIVTAITMEAQLKFVANAQVEMWIEAVAKGRKTMFN